MKLKKALKSKTVWTAIITTGIGVAQILGYVVPVPVITILSGVGLYSIRDAIYKSKENL